MNTSPTLPWVYGFAQVMEAKLAANREKGDREGWRSVAAVNLLLKLEEEVRELRSAVVDGQMDCDILLEAADVANFAMMIADVAGGLRPYTQEPPVTDDVLHARLVRATSLLRRCELDRLSETMKVDVRAFLTEEPDLRKSRATLEEAEVAARRLGEELGRRCPTGWGFVLIMMSMGAAGYTTYASNANRDDCIKMLREMAGQIEAGKK